MAGLAGVGNTTLAVHASHAAWQRGWFAGGILFIDFHGYDDQPAQPAQALDALLRALGIPTRHVPQAIEDRAGLYRSTLAGIHEPVLIIADNISAEARVRLLLPGAGPHQMLITSRHTLAGIGARLVDLSFLDGTAAVALLDASVRAARPGDDRITNDPSAARQLASACGGLPLALQITASTLTADCTLSAAELADALAMESGRLDQLAYDDGGGPAAPSVTPAFRLSYRKLDSSQARLLRLLAASPGADISTAAASVLTQLPVTETRALLASLARHTWSNRLPRQAGGGCMTYCACTVSGFATSMPEPMTASRPSTGCSAITSP